MSALDREILAEKASAVLRHLARVADRLERAAGFRNVVAHADERLDMARIHRTARQGPDDLRAFLATLNRLVGD